jgi:hypothetical protein
MCCVSLILALLDKEIDLWREPVKKSAFKWLRNQSGFYLTGQVVAAYYFNYASFVGPWGLRISGALPLGIFDQPEKNYFFNDLLNLS